MCSLMHFMFFHGNIWDTQSCMGEEVKELSEYWYISVTWKFTRMERKRKKREEWWELAPWKKRGVEIGEAGSSSRSRSRRRVHRQTETYMHVCTYVHTYTELRRDREMCKTQNVHLLWMSFLFSKYRRLQGSNLRGRTQQISSLSP